MARVASIDTKVHIVLGIAVGVLVLASSLLSKNVPIVSFGSLLYFLGIISFAIVVFFGLLAYFFADFKYPPNMKAVYQDSLKWPPGSTKNKIISSVIDGICFNESAINSKLFKAKCAFFALIVEIAFLVLAILLR